MILARLTHDREHQEARRLISAAFDLARSLGVKTLLVQAESDREVEVVQELRRTERVLWMTHHLADLLRLRVPRDLVVELPDGRLTRMSQIKLGLFVAVLRGHVGTNETIVCLAGLPGIGPLDTLVVTTPRRDFPWLRRRLVRQMSGLVALREFARLLDLSLRFASQGREGKPLGALFILGDPAEVAPHVRQLVLNPFAGHPREDRNIHDPEFAETLREFATMDGAFIIDNEGTVESAGTYIRAGGCARVHPGLGARHAAAAAITTVTSATALVVSESSGTVTVFHRGLAMLELEKPQPC